MRYIRTMSIVISHSSALEYWRSVRVGERRYIEAPRAKNLVAKPPSAFYEGGTGPWWLSAPLHVLVSKAESRRWREGIVNHVWSGSLPKGSILKTGNGFYVCSPALTFLQVATDMNLIELIRLGFEFCGTYDCSSESMVSCMSLCGVDRLYSFAGAMKHVHGRKNALRALGHVAQNAASPRESLLVMLLCLPYKLGGYGLSLPKLNYRIDVGKRAKKTATKNYYVCDLYWPDAKLAVEYDSDSFHVGAQKIASDSARRNALEAMGITVVVVTKRQMNSVVELDGIAHLLAKKLGKRLRYSEEEFSRQRIRLRTELLSLG